MRYADIRTYLADCLLPKVDVATMAHGLELRAPLLDHEVLEFALSLPDEYVLDGAADKRVLRAVLARYLPRALFERPKQGFSLPLRDWFRGGVRAAAEGLATSERLQATGWFRPGGIAALAREHVDGKRDHSQRLYSLLALDEWLKIA
jgi:asparagine synthase (glutamine-hydrolysing)